jgi:hypothetical protein
MGIVGIIALVVGAVALLVWYLQAKSQKRMALSETLSCGELGELAKAATDVVGGGSFSQRCEVVGVAAAGEHGLLTAPDSGREVVWHQTRVTERYWDEETDSDGTRRRVDKTRVLATHSSEDPFVVQDATGTIVVEPKEAEFDSAPKLVDRIDNGSAPRPELGEGKLANLAEGLVASARSDRSTGLQHEEWGIPVGQRLYILAEASDRGGRLAMVRPAEGGGFMISTKTEEELRESSRQLGGIALKVAVGSGVVGAVFLILDLVL